MLISLPQTWAIRKQTSEKVIEIKLPNINEKVKKNKFVSAFLTVLSSPVK